METKHTATPWKVGYNDGSGFASDDFPECGATIVSADESNVIIFSGNHDGLPYGANAANAAFIVRAVNAHDELVAALELAAEYIRKVSNESIGAESDYADYGLLDTLETALENAKG